MSGHEYPEKTQKPVLDFIDSCRSPPPPESMVRSDPISGALASPGTGRGKVVDSSGFTVYVGGRAHRRSRPAARRCPTARIG